MARRRDDDRPKGPRGFLAQLPCNCLQEAPTREQLAGFPCPRHPEGPYYRTYVTIYVVDEHGDLRPWFGDGWSKPVVPPEQCVQAAFDRVLIYDDATGTTHYDGPPPEHMEITPAGLVVLR